MSWNECKYVLPELHPNTFGYSESDWVIVYNGQFCFVAKLIRCEEEDEEPLWQMFGPDAYTYKLTHVLAWHPLPPLPQQ